MEKISHSLDYTGTVSVVENKAALKHVMNITSPQYNGEDIEIDEHQVQFIRELAPGLRSQLGNMLYMNPAILKSGLWGGTLNLNWPLLTPKNSAKDLRFRGLKTVDGVKYYEFEYMPRQSGNNGDLRISIYLDPQTMRHVRTLYRFCFSQQGNDKNYRLDEQFEDFVTSDGLTLPSRWKISWLLEESNSPREYLWNIKIHKLQNGAGMQP
jgi:hypothetical protein